MKILTNTRTLQAALKRAVTKKLNSEQITKFDDAINELNLGLHNLLGELIMDSPEVASLFNGKLKADFGLDEDVLSRIQYHMSYLVEVTYTIENHPKKGPIIVYSIMPRKKDDPYAHDTISALSYTSDKSGEKIRWLEWLLFRGTEKINDTYSVQYMKGLGRSGMAIMRILKDSNGFSVDPEFAGTEDDNMVTRAIIRNRDKIIELFSRYGNVTQ